MRWTTMPLILAGLMAAAPPAPKPAPPAAPNPLPTAINDASSEPEKLVSFDAEQLVLKHVDGRHQVWAGKQLLKDLGPNEREAREVLRLIHDLHFTRYGTIDGATPAFEFWLNDNAGVTGGLTVKNVIPFNPGALKLENVAGAWVIRADRLLLYNFGNRQQAAAQALAVLHKYGFNQMGIIGMPNPVMTYLTIDTYAHAPAPREQVDTRELINAIAQQSLMLPNVGYAGVKLPIEQRKLDVQRIRGDWSLVHDKDVLGRFGPNFMQAREALRLLQDARVTELCLIGKSRFPVYLSNGQPPRHAGLGFNNLRLQPESMKIKIINNVYCIAEGERIVFEFGDNQADAELVLKVLQHFKFDQLCPLGDFAQGGMRLLIRSK